MHVRGVLHAQPAHLRWSKALRMCEQRRAKKAWAGQAVLRQLLKIKHSPGTTPRFRHLSHCILKVIDRDVQVG
jgi:hypothetical protein